MKPRNQKKRSIKSTKPTSNGDIPNQKRRKSTTKSADDFFASDDEIQSESEVSDAEQNFFSDDEENGGVNGEGDDNEEEDRETVDERRKRLAVELLKAYRKGEEREREDDDDDDDEGRDDREGVRDSLVAKVLQQEQLEESGRMRRLIASKLNEMDTKEEPRLLLKHRQSATAVALSDDDVRGFSASKDGCIAHWDVETGKAEKYLWPSNDVLKSHGVKEPKGRSTKHSNHILALATSSDGRYLATAGLDRHVHLWDTRTREHIQAFPGHRGPVSCLTFRQGTSELFSGSYDRTIKIWNAEDRAYITTLFGHQSEVLSIDCLRKERALSAGRDRTMQLWKVPEETHLIFRAPASSLECCCFVSNDEFLSGSDDGSIELWGVLRKKPVTVVRNAHALPPTNKQVEHNERVPNGHAERDVQKVDNPCSTARSWVGSVTVCRNSDLAASGAGNGEIRLWAIDSENRGLKPLFDVPLTGYVNSLAFAKSGRFLVAAVGQEPRLGRWDRIKEARNGVVLQSFNLLS